MVGAALVVVAAIIERRVGSAVVAHRALAATFNVVVPLASFGVAAEASARGNLRDAVWSAARFGLARRDVALGAIGAALPASAALGAGFAALAVVVAHARGNPPLGRDLVTSALDCGAGVGGLHGLVHCGGDLRPAGRWGGGCRS